MARSVVHPGEHLTQIMEAAMLRPQSRRASCAVERRARHHETNSQNSLACPACRGAALYAPDIWAGWPRRTRRGHAVTIPSAAVKPLYFGNVSR
jgi:hypothetical protein